MKTKKAATRRPARSAGKASRKEPKRWILRLYVAGNTPRSLTAFSNLKKICEEKLPNEYTIEVIDLSKQPELAKSEQIVALPTLIRKLPAPMKRVIGDLSDIQAAVVGMNLVS